MICGSRERQKVERETGSGPKPTEWQKDIRKCKVDATWKCRSVVRHNVRSFTYVKYSFKRLKAKELSTTMTMQIVHLKGNKAFFVCVGDNYAVESAQKKIYHRTIVWLAGKWPASAAVGIME